MDPTQLPLRDLHMPPAIGWWPLAPGWWALLAIAAAATLWFAYQSFLRWRAGKPRRSALRQLTLLVREYQGTGDIRWFSMELSELLRRAMLAYAPRSDVAGLTGRSWLRWLDRGMEERAFSAGAGQSLGSLPYRNPELGEEGVDVDGLVEAVRKRLQTPIVGSAR